jgi:filamentous hemagglutinin family protein
MNKHIHRLVFDRRRGMRVPAAEHTRGASKAAGGQTRVAAVASVVSLLVAPLAQAQVVSANVSSLTASGTANRLSVSGTNGAMSATRSVSDMVSQVLAASGRNPLPVWGSFKADDMGKFQIINPTAEDLALLRVLQSDGAIVINWDSFDIAKGYTVRFEQPTGGRALNKVRNGLTSVIDGTLQANGEVMFENGAGIIFGKNARVNTGSLVATALSVTKDAIGKLTKPEDKKNPTDPDSFANPDDPNNLNLTRFRDGKAVFEGSNANTASFVAVEQGAVIQSAAGGKVMLVAPRVVNKGLIETPQGNTVLAAGQRVYLFAPTDLAQRGLIVAVDNFDDATLKQIEAQYKAENGLKPDAPMPADFQALGTVENVREGGSFTSGLVRADRGTINMVGAAIRQKGQLTATTAVKGENGAIFLRAMKDSYLATASDGITKYRDAGKLGAVELASGSITEVLPSAAGLITNEGEAKDRVAATSLVEGVAKGDDASVADVVLRKIGVRPDEVLRAPETIAEPSRPTVPAEDATDEVKAKYVADLAKYNADKQAFDAQERVVQRSADTFYRSRIDVLGSSIELGASYVSTDKFGNPTTVNGARLQAPAGEINLLAADNWESSVLRTTGNVGAIKDNSRIVMGAGSVVDVSGLDNLALPIQRKQMQTQFFSIELADSPVQRSSVIYRKTVMADAGKLLGLGDTSGFYNNQRYTAGEYSTAGGLVRIQAQGALLQDPDSRVDISGGAVTYDGGSLIQSVLLRNGAITLAGNASKDVRYDGFLPDPANATKEELARYGLSGLSFAPTTNQLSQFVGKSAGVAIFGAPVQSLGAQVDGSVRMSEVQRASSVMAGFDPGLRTMLTAEDTTGPAWSGLDNLAASDRTVQLSSPLTSGSPHLFASLKPTAGQLVVGRELGAESPTRALDNLVNSVRIASNLAAPKVSVGLTGEAWQNLLASVGSTTVLGASQLQQSGLGTLTVFSNQLQWGQPGVDAPSLQLAAGGGMTAKALQGNIDFHGSLTSPGGNINLWAQSGSFKLTSGSRLDASGTKRDDGFVGALSSAPALAGGQVTIRAAGDVVLASGSEVDVSGAAWRGLDKTLVKGRAGTITLETNVGQTGTRATTPNGMLTLAGTLTGFDFTDGGSLVLKGLPSVVLGGAQKGAFSLDTGLYADRGFGRVDASALGDVKVLAGTVVRPVLRNLLGLSAEFGSITGETHFVGTLQAGERSGTQLALSASTTPNVLVQNGLPQGANLTVESKAELDMGLGGGVALSAGGNLDFGGTIKAYGGKVSLTLLGDRGVSNVSAFEDYGYLAGQTLTLRKGSLIDVSGAVKAVERRSTIAALLGLPQPQVGTVLAGGTVTLGGTGEKAVRGRLHMEEGSTVRMNGARGLLSSDGLGVSTQISSAAGTLNIASTDGFTLLGSVEANAPDGSVAGGTLNVVLSNEGMFDSPPTGGAAYPNGDRRIRIADGNAKASDLIADNAKVGKGYGEGVMSASLVNGSGFDRVSLRADDSIQLNGGVNLKADEGRTRLQQIVLDAPVLSLTGDYISKITGDSDQADLSPTHIIQAHQVSMGPATRLSGAVNVNATPASQRDLSGTQRLEVQAGLIELRGDTAVAGANQVSLNATLGRTASTTLDRLNGEIRFIGQRPLVAAVDADRSLKGQFSFNGTLNLKAGQVYATTLSNYAVKGATGSTLNVVAPAGGSTSQTPLSAMAALNLSAETVNIDGVVRQPVGSISVKARELNLGPRAVLSVSADGVTVPVGTTVNGSRWVYSPDGSTTEPIPAAGNLVQDLSDKLLTKQISLEGGTLEDGKLTLSSTTALEAQAGGDLLAWEFKPGVGGSTDTLNRKDVFAVLPNYGYDFAPHDSEIRARTQQVGTELKAGDQVTISTPNGVLAAGTYTLLDARYGILPGAVLVSASTLDVSSPLPVAAINDDGSVKVSGYRTATGTAQNGGNDARLALVLEPEATFRAKSQLNLTSINAYMDERARSSGSYVPRAGDAGRISLSSTSVFNWLSNFRLQGQGGFKAGELDLAMPDIVVRRNAPAAGASATVNVLDQFGAQAKNAEGQDIIRKAGVVGMDQLEQLGADSVMLGGVRETVLGSDGKAKVRVTRVASIVSFEGEVAQTLGTAGELTAVAKDRVSVAPGLTLASTGRDDGGSRAYEVQGDGALLQVSHRANTTVAVQGATTQSKALLQLGSTKAGSASVALSGASVQMDSTGRAQLSSELALNSQSVGVGAGSVVVGDAQATDDGALAVKGDLLSKLNQAQNLTLRASTGGLTMAGGTQLGGSNTRSVVLDAPTIKGVAAAKSGDVVSRVVANTIETRNTSGVAGSKDAGTGTLVLDAKPVLRDGQTGGYTVGQSGSAGQHLAFETVDVRSTGDIVFRGQGTTSAQGNVTLSADRITAAGKAKQQLDVQGDLDVAKTAGGRSLNESLGGGGQLALTANVIRQAGNIDVEAGTLNIKANNRAGADEALVFAAGSTTSVAGRLRNISDTYAVASGGGSLTAEAIKGAIVVDGKLSAAAPMLPANVSGDAPHAGSVTLKAVGAGGEVRVGDNARIDLSATVGKSGQLAVDTLTLRTTLAAKASEADKVASAKAGLDRLVAASKNNDGKDNAAGSSLGAFDVRQRAGNLDLNSLVKAALVKLSADAGEITLRKDAVIDATTASGGVVQLQSDQDMTLEDGARILARSTREGANGGDVLLSTDTGNIVLGAATVAADSEGDDKDGRIVLRARQTFSGANPTGVNVVAKPGSAAATLTAGRVQLTGVRVLDSIGLTSLSTNAASASNLNLAALQTEANKLTTSALQASILNKAGLTGTANASVRAETEVRANGNFEISNDLQMAASATPMNLTVRAKGDLAIKGSVSAGLSNATNTGTVQAGEGASLRFVAGADTAAADLNATQADASKGHLTLSNGKLIRTTTGSIDVAASGDVRMMATSANSASAIYVTGGQSALASGELFATENEADAINRANAAFKPGNFTERGERLTVKAGGHIGSFASVTTSNGVASYVQQQLTQGTGNYFYHGGNPETTRAVNRVPVAWWAGYNEFLQGLGSFGGGNLSVTAGKDVSNLAVVSPTNGRNLLADPKNKTYVTKVLNGGDVTVSAQGDIVGGVYFLGRGEGRLNAGGGLLPGADALTGSALPSASQTSDPGAMLALMDGHWAVTARDDISVSHVYNPTIVPFRFTGGVMNSSTTGTAASGLNSNNAAVFYTYADNAGVSLNTLQGNVNLQPNAQNFHVQHALSAVGGLSLSQNTSGRDASALASVLPPQVSLVSHQGDVLIDSAGKATTGGFSNGSAGTRLFVMPSSKSDVNVYAGQDLTLRTNLQLLDAQQVQLGLPTTKSPALFPTSASNSINESTAQNFALLTYNLGALGGAVNEGGANANRLSSSTLSQGGALSDLLSTLSTKDLGQAGNDRLVRFRAGRDVLFDNVDVSNGSLRLQTVSFVRSNRPTEVVAGRDIVNPHFLGQNFDEADVTRLVAGRDITGVTVGLNSSPRAVLLAGPGAFELESGRDISLNQLAGVMAIGNAYNSALPEAAAKITLTAGTAQGVNLSELRTRHGSEPGLRGAINQALSESGLLPQGGGTWSQLSDDDAFAAFGELSSTRQVESIQTFLDRTFAALFLPEDANQTPAYYRSSAFQRKKQEALWSQVLQSAEAAKAIAVSTDEAEEARRKLRRQALFAAAEAVVDLAGHGRSFVRDGDVNVGQSRVHNLGQGGGNGSTRDTVGPLGGIDVMAAGQVVAGLSLPANVSNAKPGGFINYDGGSFRSISLGDFLVADQKVISLGRGDLLLYSVEGSVDAGQGSNTSVATAAPVRRFNSATGNVETVAQPPIAGSGIQKLQTPADYVTTFGLYAPKGEIRAVDAFIKGDANVDIVAPVAIGTDNIGGASGVASAPPPTVSVSLTPKTTDTAAGTKEVSGEAEAKDKAQAKSVLTVDLLGFGGEGAGAPPTAAGTTEPGDVPVQNKDKDKGMDKEKDAPSR